jgi:hypothetical protein
VDREARAVSARGSAEPNTANLLTGRYNDYKPLLAIILAVFGVVVFGALYIPLGGRGCPHGNNRCGYTRVTA